MKLSILIPSLEERALQLSNILAAIYGQIYINKADKDVEVLTLVDNRQKTTGEKRNMLLDWAIGEYIAFIDDDDEISRDYIKLVLQAIETGPDVVGMRLRHYKDGVHYGNTIHSIMFKEWENIPGTNGIWTFNRCPNHLNPVKRIHALKVKFLKLTIGEDREYSYILRRHLSSEVMIESPIYFYMEISK